MINIHKISLAYFLMAVLSTPVYAVTSDQGQASVAHEPTAQEPIVKISSGAVLGRVDDGVYAFKGIPYAQAERFMPPQPPDSWDGVRDATRFGPIAMQVNSWSPDDAMDEQRLFTVNVWTQGLNDGKKRPVMFWLHGGGFRVGDRKSTRLNSSHVAISYAVFCLKK